MRNFATSKKIRLHMRFSAFVALFVLFSLPAFAQDGIKPIPQDTVPSHWDKKNQVSFDLSEIAFVNWNAGGVSAVSGLARAQFGRFYTKGNLKWGNELIMRYGLSKQDGVEWRKTDDAVLLASTFGYRRDTLSNWFYSAKFNFNTQFSNGYNYPNTDLAISKPFAPAYTFLGVGSEYANKEKKVNLYFSPLTLKNTLVLDTRLADQGSFGVTGARYDPITGEKIRDGRKSRTELGILFTGHHRHEIFKNITLEDRLVMYTDYLNNFGNIDIDWTMSLEFLVNEYVKASVGLQMIYDDDIKAKEEIDGEQVTVGPKVQLKQMLAIGLVYNF